MLFYRRGPVCLPHSALIPIKFHVLVVISPREQANAPRQLALAPRLQAPAVSGRSWIIFKVSGLESTQLNQVKMAAGHEGKAAARRCQRISFQARVCAYYRLKSRQIIIVLQQYEREGLCHILASQTRL